MTNFRGKKVVVMGLGLHGGGVAAVTWLLKQKAKVVVTDLRSEVVLQPSLKRLKRRKNLAYILGRHRPQDFRTADIIIKNPGVPKGSKFLRIARQAGATIETEMSIFFQYCSGSIIGITGTKGKSTTATLTHALLKKAGFPTVLAGNIRISPLAVLPLISKKTQVVLELSSWQLEDMVYLKRSPHIAVITNVMPDHLNRYSSMREYGRAKELIFRFQTKEDKAVLNLNNYYTKSIGTTVKGERWWFSRRQFSEQNGSFIRGDKVYYRHRGAEQFICFTKDIRLPGKHNLENALAALTVAKLLEVSNTNIRKVLHAFHGLADRFEQIRIWRGIRFYNDTTATTPQATIAALNNFNKKIILIAGGSDKKLFYSELAKNIKQKAKRLILLDGSATAGIAAAVRRVGFERYEIVESMEEAVKGAVSYAAAGDAVVLSPAAASFGMFDNEFDRGDQFKKFVKGLK